MTRNKRRSMAASMLLSVTVFVVVLAGMRTPQGILVLFLRTRFIAIIGTPDLNWPERQGISPVMALLLIVLGIVAVGVSGSIAVCLPQSEEGVLARRDWTIGHLSLTVSIYRLLYYLS
jgi:predicted PurR-regulated permease PerM